jgi:hypothetical protein
MSRSQHELAQWRACCTPSFSALSRLSQDTRDVRAFFHADPSRGTWVDSEGNHVVHHLYMHAAAHPQVVHARLASLPDRCRSQAAQQSNARGFLPLHTLLWFVPGHLSYKHEWVLNELTWNPEAVGASDFVGRTPLHVALRQGHWDLLPLLLDLGASWNSPDADGYTPLHLLAQSGHDAWMERVLGDASVDDTAVTHDGNTLLHLACRHQHVAMATVLLENGVPLDGVNGHGQVPRDWARFGGLKALFDEWEAPKQTSARSCELP